jgi:hypothetical protein
MGIALVTLLLLVQLSFFPTRSMAFQYYGKNWPWMKLPVATKQNRCCVCSFVDELSWTKTGGWVGRAGSVRPGEIEGFLKDGIERGRERGRSYTLRLRIPADADAGKFMEAAMAAQRAGVAGLHVAVVKGGVAKF